MKNTVNENNLIYRNLSVESVCEQVKSVLHRNCEPRSKNISAFQTSPRVDDV